MGQDLEILCLLNVYESWNWIYSQLHWKKKCMATYFWSPIPAIYSFVIDCRYVTARVARMWTFVNRSSDLSAIPYWSCIFKNAVCIVKSFLRTSAIAVKLPPINNSPAGHNPRRLPKSKGIETKNEPGHVKLCSCPPMLVQVIYHHVYPYSEEKGLVNKWEGVNYQASGLRHLPLIQPMPYCSRTESPGPKYRTFSCPLNEVLYNKDTMGYHQEDD